MSRTNERVSLSLTGDQVAAILSVGGPTFSPRGGNRFRCNQAPQLGLLRGKHCESLRRIIRPSNPISILAKSRESYRVETATISRDGNQVTCPYCQGKIYNTSAEPIRPGEIRCTSPICRKVFNAEAPPPLPIAEWVPNWEGAKIAERQGYTFCPNPSCRARKAYIGTGEMRCHNCGLSFMVVTSEESAGAILEGLISHGDAQCPRSACKAWNWEASGDIKPGTIVTCRGCEKKFKAVAR